MVRVHPVRESFLQAAGDRAAKAIRQAGHELWELDLYDEAFQPVLSENEWRARREGARPLPEQRRHADALKWADHLVLVYPTWFGGFPAMLKGWLDCVWVEGVAYECRRGSPRQRSLLRHIRGIAVVTTHGGSKFMNSLGGEPGRRMVRRGLRSMCSIRCRTSWIAFYGNDRCDNAARVHFLDRVEHAFDR